MIGSPDLAERSLSAKVELERTEPVLVAMRNRITSDTKDNQYRQAPSLYLQSFDLA